MAQLGGLSYLFRIDELQENSCRLRADGSHEWLPPRAYGSHSVNVNESPSTVFRFTASATRPGQPYERRVEHYSLPEHIRVYQCYTMYVGMGDEIFVVNYDATEYGVFDGDDTGGIPDHNSRPPARDDWAELSFQHSDARTDAYVTHANPSATHLDPYLHLHTDQHLASALVTQRYRDLSNPVRVRLGGATALMIGLLALSVSPTQVTNEVPRVMQDQWHYHQAEGNLPTEPRRARRGVRVTVWLDDSTNKADMVPYELGALLGPFYS